MPTASLSPKRLFNKFHRLDLTQPNSILKDRITPEIKLLLCYIGISAKEIACNPGYEDPAYLNRLSAAKTGDAPSAFCIIVSVDVA